LRSSCVAKDCGELNSIFVNKKRDVRTAICYYFAKSQKENTINTKNTISSITNDYKKGGIFKEV